jgi:hypothetical protein
MATNTDVAATQLAVLGGATNAGLKIGLIDSVAKAAQNDTFTVSNATTIIFCIATTDADGVADPCTISGNVVTMTSATATPPSAVIIYQ